MKRLIKLSEEELDTLDRRLSIASSKLTPGEMRGTGLQGERIEVPKKRGIEKTKEEIKENYQKGVEIASQTESRPLISLFKAAKVELPPEIKVDKQQMHYNFYWVEVTFSSLLPKSQFLLSSELELTLSDDVHDSARRTRPIRLFPDRKDIDLFKIDLEGAIGIDQSMNISVPMLGTNLLPFKKAAIDANVKAKIVVGPFHFGFRKAAIEVKGKSDQFIHWRYNLQSELYGTNDFKSVLVLKIAEEATDVQISASLGVVPCKRRWLIFKEVLPPISDQRTLPVELVK